MLPPDAPDLVALDLLASVAELGSLGRVAQRHGISQPAVSMRMDRLERQLGVAVLERGPTGTRLTGDGERLLVWAGRVLEATAGLLAAADGLRTGSRLHLRVGASLTVADHRMPGWLFELHRARPGVATALEVHNSTAVVDLVRRGEVELGFVEGPVGDAAGLRTRSVGGDELCVIVAPGHPWARRRRPLGGPGLASAELIVREPTSGTRRVVEAALAPWGGVRTHRELGSTAAILGAVRRGEGPGVLSLLAAADDLEAGRLVAVATEGVALTRPFTAVWRRAAPLGDAARHLLDLAGRPVP